MSTPSRRARGHATLGLSLRSRSQLIATGAIDPARWRADLLRHVTAQAPRLGAFAYWRPADFTHYAIPAEMTVSYKDNIGVAGYPSGFGLVNGYQEWPQESAEVVRRLSGLGCVTVGKTAMTEVSIGTRIPCPNPAYPDVSAGGSSTGAAVATVAGLCDIGVGTDSGGSIRWPAVYCGGACLRLTYDQSLLDGVLPVAPSMESIGLITKSTDDLSYAWFDAGLRSMTPRPADSAADRQVIAFGLVTTCLGESTDPEITSAVTRLAAELTNAGHRVDPVSVGWWKHRGKAWDLLSREAYLTSRARELGPYHPGTARALARGSAISDAQYCDGLVARDEARSAARRDFSAAGTDVWVLPLDPHLADRPPRPDRDSTFPACQEGDALGFTIPASLAGIPVVAMPIGHARDGRPIGLQLWGPPGGEDTLVRAAGLISNTIRRSGHVELC